jgi:hypothetical protein
LAVEQSELKMMVFCFYRFLELERKALLPGHEQFLCGTKTEAISRQLWGVWRRVAADDRASSFDPWKRK